MPDELDTEEVREQLRLYCGWLNTRSGVGLSSEVESRGPHALTGLPPTGGLDPKEPAPRSWPFLALVGGVAAVVTAGGVFAMAGGGNPNDTATAADDQGPVSLETDVAADDATSGSTQMTVDPEPTAQAATEQEDQAAESADDGTSDADDADGGQPAADDDSSTGYDDVDTGPDDDGSPDDGSDVATTTEIGDPPDDGRPEIPTTSDDTTPSTEEPDYTVDTVTFLSPSHQSTIDMNLGTDVRVGAVDGASTYTFTTKQSGRVLSKFTMNEPGFKLPSQLNAGFGFGYEPGLMTITVVAHGDDGRELATGSIDVVMQSGGSPPRFGSSTPLPPGPDNP